MDLMQMMTCPSIDFRREDEDHSPVGALYDIVLDFVDCQKEPPRVHRPKDCPIATCSFARPFCNGRLHHLGLTCSVPMHIPGDCERGYHSPSGS